jgi:hypothetical protein
MPDWPDPSDIVKGTGMQIYEKRFRNGVHARELCERITFRANDIADAEILGLIIRAFKYEPAIPHARLKANLETLIKTNALSGETE